LTRIKKTQEIAIKQSRLKIPLIFGLDVIHGYKTGFPIPLALSASWRPDLVQKAAYIAAKEASADGINWTYSPMADISRDPRWGRVAEGAGEDPFLASRITEAFVKGYQGDDLSKNYTIMACLKHFALYGAAEAGRDYNSVDMSMNRMYNEYFPPYKAAIDAGAATVMTSFNDINGVPSTANKWLLTDVLRREWGFKGFVVTDFTAIKELKAHGLGDEQKVAARALKAGTDMDMVGEDYLKTLKKSVQENIVSEEDINKACKRVLEMKYNLGLFDDPYRYLDEKRLKTDILTPEHRKSAREIASETFVLMKNNNQILPLKKTDKIAFIGPLLDDKVNMPGTWSVVVDSKESVTLKNALEELPEKNNFSYSRGCNITENRSLEKNSSIEFTKEQPRISADILLKEAIEKGKRVIVTTLQKFPVISDVVAQNMDKNYAVIIDEAHSSQAGESARHLRKALSLEEAETADGEEKDLDDLIAEEIKKKGDQTNISFFAFTATPKPKTLELFGTIRNGQKVAFDLYTMEQAIKEGFIKDVLKNYVSWK
ncbi:MAG: glycoside hydrolase family 3 N-terminal domain-containing protein, partial [Chryseobacterium taeanense]